MVLMLQPCVGSKLFIIIMWIIDEDSKHTHPSSFFKYCEFNRNGLSTKGHELEQISAAPLPTSQVCTGKTCFIV